MKVLLASSYTLPGEPPLFPLGLAHLASMLEGHEMRCFDFNSHPHPDEAVRDLAKRYAPDVVGLSIRNMFFARPGQIWSPLNVHTRVVRLLRESCPAARLIVGGAGFSLYARMLMQRWPEVDLGVFGEGEHTFRRLVDGADDASGEPGVFYRRDGRVEYGGDRPWIDFDALPSPRWDLVDLAPYRRHITSIGLQSRRGCALRCLHCSDLYLLGPCVRLRSPGKVADDVEGLFRRHGVDRFMFADQVFNVPREHAEAVCLELRRRRLPVRWSAWFNEAGVTPGFLALCKEAGCETAHFSPDSAHDPTLRVLRKNMRSRDIHRACRAARRARLPMTLDFMINGPGETAWGIVKTVLVILAAKLYLGKLLHLHGRTITFMRIYPHTELRRLAVRQGILSPDDDLLEVTYYERGLISAFGRLVVGLETLVWNLISRLRRQPRETPDVPAGRH